MGCIVIPTFTAPMVRGPEGSTLGAIRTVIRCLELDIPEIRGEDSKELMVYVHEGDKRLIDRVRDIVTRIIIEQIRMATRYLQSVLAEALRLETMEGDSGVDIFAFLPEEDLVNFVCSTRELGNKVQDACNIRQQYELFYQHDGCVVAVRRFQ